jgi:hypothetical protein
MSLVHFFALLALSGLTRHFLIAPLSALPRNMDVDQRRLSAYPVWRFGSQTGAATMMSIRIALRFLPERRKRFYWTLGQYDSERRLQKKSEI